MARRRALILGSSPIKEKDAVLRSLCHGRLGTAGPRRRHICVGIAAYCLRQARRIAQRRRVVAQAVVADRRAIMRSRTGGL